MPPGPNPQHAAAEATLTDADREAIREAILQGYPYRETFYNLLEFRLGVRVRDFCDIRQGEALVIKALVDWAKGPGRTLELLSLAWTEKLRENEALQSLAARFFTAPEEEVRRYAAPEAFAKAAQAPPPPDEGALEAILLREVGPLADLYTATAESVAILADMEAMRRLAAAACVVEIGSGIRASGFLIGRRAVLTVHHALEDAIAASLAGKNIRLVFDRHAEAPEVAHLAAPGPSWLGVFRPASSADRDGHGEAAANELDFAVVMLEQAVDPTRQPLRLPGTVPFIAPGDPMVIAQHPNAGSLQIAVGSLVGYSADGERLHYLANTAPGSAGAPVLSANGDLIAVHHAARMVGENRVAQGVPIWPIRQAIVAAGYPLEAL